MKNLRERIKEAPGGVLCPLTRGTCIYLDFPDHYSDCAHYNPDTQECIHVLAAQAQVAIAKALLPVAAAESEQTGDIRQAAEWLEQGKMVCKDYWEYNYLQAVHGTVLIHGIRLGNIVRSAPWNPSPADLLYPRWRVVEKGGRPNE